MQISFNSQKKFQLKIQLTLAFMKKNAKLHDELKEIESN